MTEDPARRQSSLGMIGGAAGAAAGYAVTRYTDLLALVPLGGALLFGLLAARVVGPDRKPAVPAFAVQAGQLLWFVVGAVVTGQYQAVLLDMIILAVGLPWLLARPGWDQSSCWASIRAPASPSTRPRSLRPRAAAWSTMPCWSTWSFGRRPSP